jgi:hypothetical protein
LLKTRALVTTAVFAVLFGLAVDQVYAYLGIHARAVVGQAADWVPPWVQVLGGLALLALSVKPVAHSLRAKLGFRRDRLIREEGEQGLSVNAGAENTACGCSSCSTHEG